LAESRFDESHFASTIVPNPNARIQKIFGVTGFSEKRFGEMGFSEIGEPLFNFAKINSINNFSYWWR